MGCKQIICRGWLVFGCGGVLIAVTIACGGAVPASPSAPSPTLSTQQFTSTVSPGRTVLPTSLTSGSDGSAGQRSDGSGARDRGEQRRRRYCESVPPGGRGYERCQAWLNSERGDGASERDEDEQHP